MNTLRGAIFISIIFSVLSVHAAVINGQAFVRSNTAVYTCIGSPVYVEKVEGESSISLLEKISDLMWDLAMLDDDKKSAKTETEKKDVKKKEQELLTDENKKMFSNFIEMLKSGKIKKEQCDTEGRFFFEDLSAGYYVVGTMIRPSIYNASNSIPLHKRIEVKEKHRNQVILYLED